MTLLSSPFSLLDIRDVEAFTGRIVKRSGLQLSVEDREELHVYLIEECWLLSTRFSPSRVTFSTIATNTLKLRVVDWQRQRFGRRTWRFRDKVYERPRVTLVSLDDPGNDRLEQALATQAGDLPSDCDPAFGGLLDDGDRQRARDYESLGLEPPRRAT